ncbi:MAG: PfkB family carbohydrate kinase [Myxococcales bacterium]|nr:PfkB family carbohydrate kinase [Myxococcales bacterium]MDD9968263.1 PfkB family carbohydrate kinase [Myxococcales bacterium]
MNPLLVVGSVAFDTLHFHDASHPRVLGGSATYGALAASHFVPVRMVGVVGKDFPDSAVQMLKERKVDLSGLEVVDGETFHWEGRYVEDLSSRETIRTDLNVFADFRPKIPDAFQATPYVMLGNIGPDLQLEVLEQITRPKLVVADTMNLWIDIKHNELCNLLKRVDVLILNDEEARQLSGRHNLLHAGRELQAMGPRTVVIKKGEHGAMLMRDDQLPFCMPALPLESVVDPTGAGDSFAGAFLGYLARHDDITDAAMRRAVVHGSVVASFCVEGVSINRLHAASDDAITERSQTLRNLVQF